MADNYLKAFTKGVHNLISPEVIPKDAAQDSSNFVTKDGRVILVGGRKLIGAEGTVGKITGEHFGYKVDGTKVHYRKAGTVIQYLNGSTWDTIITGLEENEDYSFANYSSLAGAFTFVNGKSAYYKMVNANPANPINVYNATQNFYGRIIIDRGRTLLWNREKDKTGLYGSYIDRQNSTVYTTVTSEAIGASGSTTYTGWLAAKAVKATGTLTSDATAPSDGETVTIGSTVYTFKTAIATAYDVLIGGSAAIALDNLKSAINKTAGEGTTYGTGTLIHPTVEATTNTDTTQVLLAKTAGTAGNAIVTTETSAHLSFGAGTLGSGTQNDQNNVFGVSFVATVVAGTETFTDNYVGVLTSNYGGTGTINYATGQYSITFSAATTGAVTANYQHETSNNKGVADFTHSATRLASEGFQFPQDVGGDAILNVLIGQDGNYYSLKSQSAYKLALEETDLTATNEVYRTDIGIPYWKAAVSTSRGIVFINTANPSEPTMTILQKNPLGVDVEPIVIFGQFDFSLYNFDDCHFGTYDRWVLVFCKSANATNNDTILMCDVVNKTVDIVNYSGRTSVQDNGSLYVGDSITKTVYQIFNGFDDLDNPIQNFWTSKAESYNNESLKKFRRLRIKGIIDPDQTVQVYVNYDNSGFQLVGTIVGSGSYVNYSSSQAIGSNFIGESQIGGDDSTNAYDYFIELKLKVPKFRTRTIKLVATGIGYFDFNSMMDWDILLFENRIPKAYRQKQNVSLDGTSVDN